MLVRTLFLFLVLAAPVLCASLTGSESDDGEASVKNAEDETAEGNKLWTTWIADQMSGDHEAPTRQRREVVEKAAGQEEPSNESSESKADEAPTPRHVGSQESYPGPIGGHIHPDWQQPILEPHLYDVPYPGQGYGYPYGGPVSPYSFVPPHYCPPCNCKESRQDQDQENDEDVEGGDYDEGEEDYYHSYLESDLYPPIGPFDPTIRYQYGMLRGKAADKFEDSYGRRSKRSVEPGHEEEDYHSDGHEYDLLKGLEAVSDKSEDVASGRRSKRSVYESEPFDWYSTGKPSKFLEKHNVGYRIKNHLRKRLRNEYFPLHYGHIRLGSGFRGSKKRQFGDYADFDARTEATAFSYLPKGPWLGSQWVRHGFPVYGYNLYQLHKPLYGKLVDKKFTTTLKDDGPHVVAKPGVYRMVMILDDARGLIIESVSSGHRYLLKNVLYDGKTLKRFQALAAWKDKEAKFFKVEIPVWGLAYLVRPSPLAGANPKVQRQRHSYGSKFPHLHFTPSLLKPKVEQNKIKLQHKRRPMHGMYTYKKPTGSPMGNDPMGNDPMDNDPMDNDIMDNDPMDDSPSDGDNQDDPGFPELPPGFPDSPPDFPDVTPDLPPGLGLG